MSIDKQTYFIFFNKTEQNKSKRGYQTEQKRVE